MKKQRYLPFGYHMVTGKIEINPEESILVQKLYTSYLKGSSLRKLTDMSEQSTLPYRENTCSWNINMIARILDDNRYWNHIDFPPILDAELAGKVASMRKQKATPKSSMWEPQKRLICSHCGAKLSRYSKSKPQIYWNCKGCGIRLGPLSDDDLLQAVTEKIAELCQNPQQVNPEPILNKSISLQAVRLSNEIDQELSQRNVDADKLIALIQEYALEKYRQCHVDESDHLTHRLKFISENHVADIDFNQELLDQITDKVILQPDYTVQLKLVNQKII